MRGAVLLYGALHGAVLRCSAVAEAWRGRGASAGKLDEAKVAFSSAKGCGGSEGSASSPLVTPTGSATVGGASPPKAKGSIRPPT